LLLNLFLYHIQLLYGKHIVYSDGGGTRILNHVLYAQLQSTFEKSIIERAIEYVKD